jgi:hypothetical protein
MILGSEIVDCLEQQQFVARKLSCVGSVWILHSGRDQYSR